MPFEAKLKDYQIIPLIASPSPRDIPEVVQAMALLKDDKVYAKYMDEFSAYRMIRKFFLRYKKYTHLVIIPDDLVVTSADYEKLRAEEEKFNYPVFSGTCNLDWQRMNLSITCRELPDKHESGLWTEYKYMTNEELEACKDNPIIKVGFGGFACCFIRRDIVEQIDLSGYRNIAAFDYQFSKDLLDRGIPEYCDTSVRSLHLGRRRMDQITECWGVGVHEPKMRFEESIVVHRRDTGYEEMIESFKPYVET